MNFNELTIQESFNLKPLVKEPKETQEEKRYRINDNKRFIIGCDPYDPDTIDAAKTGMNVFTVVDRTSIRVSTKVWTRKSFDDFVKWFLKKEDSKVPFVISHKFIKDGKPAPIVTTQDSLGGNTFERYNASF